MAYKLFSDRHLCYFCGCKKPDKAMKYKSLVEVHHIKHREDGGLDHPGNLVPCCPLCHAKIHNGIIKIIGWFDLAYCHKLKWIDEKGLEQFGPRDLL